MSYDPKKPSAYDAIFQKAADEAGVSYGLLRKLAFNESSFNPNAVSKTGPVGIMQFTKATAAAMGLSPEDRKNPELAIPAAARHLSDLVKKFGGDELKAALAYNQGEGRLGSPQLAAYDSGEFDKISPEGVGYMRKLLDVAQSPASSSIENFGGITPKANGVDFDTAMDGIRKDPKKAGENLPESTGFTVEGKEQAPANKPYSQAFFETHGTTVEEYEDRSTFFGFKDSVSAEVANSTLGMAFRAARVDNGYDVFKDTITPTKWNSHEFTPEEIEKIRTQVKNPSYINVVTGGSPENLDALIKLANENYERDTKAADSGLGAKLSAGVIGAGVDPLSYVPIAGQAAKGFKMASKAVSVGLQSGAANVVSEGIRTSIAGGDAHYAEAMLGGMVFGAGMSVVVDTASKAFRKAGSVEAPNEFAGPAMRLEARETARNTDGVDTSKLPPSEDRVFSGEYNGVKYSPLETEPGAVVLQDGSIISATNPINPQTLKKFAEINPERAARGVNLGGLSEIGLKVLRSESKDIRGIGSDLLRSPTGMESGASGKFGATASDIHERLHSTDQRSYNDLNDAMKQVQKDPQWSVGAAKSSALGVRQFIYKKAALAIENPALQVDLTKAERKVMDIMKAHFDTKRELMENPAVFGNGGATSIFPNSRHKGTYVPNVYTREAKALYSQTLGADGLQEAISKSWLTSYHARPDVKKRVDEGIAEAAGIDVKAVTPEMVQKYANDKAYGIAKSDEFTGSSVLDDNIEGLVGIENNSFLEARNLFDSDMATTLPDGSTFSVNDLRDFDMKYLMPAYDRRVNGDIAIMGGSGKTTKDLKEQVVALQTKYRGDGTKMGEVKALQDTIKILTGRARRNQDTPLEVASRVLTDLSFFAKNAYMGAQNITEVAGMLAQGNVKAMLHGIPYLRELAFKKSPVSGKELNDLHASLFGKEMDDLIRPTRQDIIDRIRSTTSAGDTSSAVLGTVKFATGELAARSPWPKLLNGTSNYILDTARQGLLGDVISKTLAGKTSKFAKPGMLKSAAITKEQWEGVQNLIREHMVRGTDGKYTVKDKKAFTMDPRAMDLWRMADKVADETMLRPHKVSLQDAAALGGAAKMALQFKSFTIKSLNSKFIKSYYEATKNARAIDQALTWALSVGIATSYFAGQAHVKALGLPEEQRKDYLKKALDPTMLAYAGISRSSHLGAPMSLLNMVAAPAGFDQARMLRSTILPKGDQFDDRKKDKSVNSRGTSANLAAGIAEQIPAMGYLGAVGGSAINLAGVLNANSTPTEKDFMTGLFNTTRELVPNDPLSQQMLMHIYEANGIHIKAK